MKNINIATLLVLLFSLSCGSSPRFVNGHTEEEFKAWHLERKEDACKFSGLSLSQNTREAYVFDAHNDDYALGALVASASLRKYSQKDIVVMLSGHVSQKYIPYFDSIGVRHVFIETTSLPNSKLQRYAYSMIKLCSYSLTNYDRVLFVDSDTFFYASLDYLFDLKQDVDELIGPTDFFERIFKHDTRLITTALFLIVPSERIYLDMVQMSIDSPQDADMDLISLFFKDKKVTVIDVPFYLNWQFDWAGIPHSRFADMKLIHYSQPKPWKVLDPQTKIPPSNQLHYSDWLDVFHEFGM